MLAPWSPVTLPGGDGAECYSSFSFDIVLPNVLTDVYGDDVKIVAMVGSFWLQPVFETADACFPNDLAALQAKWNNYFILARGGLFKTRVTSSNLDVGGPVAHPLNGRDWSDAGWLKQWERAWPALPPQSIATTYGEGQYIGMCADVHRDAYNTPATSSGSQPLFNVPAITTTCLPVTAGNEDCLDGPSYTRYQGPPWKKVSLNTRRTIRLHEDDSLIWYCDWTSVYQSQTLCGGGGVAPEPCAMRIIPSLKFKVQYG